MKKVATIVGVVLAALALAGIAWAAAPEGKLVADMEFHPSDDLFGSIHKLGTATGAPILDGSTAFVNVNNDKSGNCLGDSGTVTVQYNHGGGNASYPVQCAHYSKTVNMSFSWDDTNLHKYVVVQILNQAAGLVIRYGATAGETAADAANALKWVNLGTAGSGNPTFTVGSPPMHGGATVTQSQT